MSYCDYVGKTIYLSMKDIYKEDAHVVLVCPLGSPRQ